MLTHPQKNEQIQYHKNLTKNKKAFLNATTQTNQINKALQNKRNNQQDAFLNASTNKTKKSPQQNQATIPKKSNGPQHKKPTKQKQNIPKNQNIYNKKEKKKERYPPTNKFIPIHQDKTHNTTKHQTNTNHPINHLKRTRPTGLAPLKKQQQHNIINSQKTHITGHKKYIYI